MGQPNTKTEPAWWARPEVQVSYEAFSCAAAARFPSMNPTPTTVFASTYDANLKRTLSNMRQM